MAIFKSSGIFTILFGALMGIIVPDHVNAKQDVVVAPAKDTAICYGQSCNIQASGNFARIRWYESDQFEKPVSLNCDDCNIPLATPLKTTRYYAVMLNGSSDIDTMMLNIRVVRPSEIHIVTDDTTIRYGQSIELQASGVSSYMWQSQPSLNKINIPNPVAKPSEPVTYYAYGLDENGCSSVDSVKVNIDYRDHLFVPSAFTPNGDGQNDIFNIKNLTFQKLRDFRIFNRQGQEIYYTMDPKKGWDGTWKGVPQQVGAYQYVIRVAYPDSYIETYQGIITLLR